ncbi:uncharacterized protein LOC116266642 [Nymphaea colorata]|nr:uncharacterized protein LOC116266642 [Nymphaea colorata]
MGNIFSSFFTGFGDAIGNLFQSPLDFIKGKSCSSVCGVTWDLICYIDHFCIVNIVKLVMVLALTYLIMLFLYLLYKVGIVDCVCRNICEMIWSFFTSCCSTLEYCCLILRDKMARVKRMKRVQEIESVEDEIEIGECESYNGNQFAYSERGRDFRFENLDSGRTRERRKLHFQRSLRPRRHQKTVEIYMHADHARGRRSICRRDTREGAVIHKIKVTRRKSMRRRPRLIGLP